MKGYAIYGSITAQEGRFEALQAYLLEAAEQMEAVDNCYCYIVGINQEEANTLNIFEVWENEAAHQVSLQLPHVQNLIAKAKPIIAKMGGSPSLTVIGGKATF